MSNIPISLLRFLPPTIKGEKKKLFVISISYRFTVMKKRRRSWIKQLKMKSAMPLHVYRTKIEDDAPIYWIIACTKIAISNSVIGLQHTMCAHTLFRQYTINIDLNAAPHHTCRILIFELQAYKCVGCILTSFIQIAMKLKKDDPLVSPIHTFSLHWLVHQWILHT